MPACFALQTCKFKRWKDAAAFAGGKRFAGTSP
jgi:hypothetical protein